MQNVCWQDHWLNCIMALMTLKAEKHFDQVVVNKNIPDNIPEYKLVGKVSIVDAIFS